MAKMTGHTFNLRTFQREKVTLGFREDIVSCKINIAKRKI